MSVDVLFKEFTSLSEREQRIFLDGVLSYLYGNTTDELDEEWEAELDQRVAAYERGETKAISGQQVEKELVEKYGIQLRPAS